MEWSHTGWKHQANTPWMKRRWKYLKTKLTALKLTSITRTYRWTKYHIICFRVTEHFIRAISLSECFTTSISPTSANYRLTQVRNYKVRRAQNTKHENWLIVLVSFPGSSLFSEVEREDPGNEVAAALKWLPRVLRSHARWGGKFK